jgi:hypothetical protein
MINLLVPCHWNTWSQKSILYSNEEHKQVLHKKMQIYLLVLFSNDVPRAQRVVQGAYQESRNDLHPIAESANMVRWWPSHGAFSQGKKRILRGRDWAPHHAGHLNYPFHQGERHLKVLVISGAPLLQELHSRLKDLWAKPDSSQNQ